MEKLGYVSSCLGLHTTSALLDIPYRVIATEYFNTDIYTSTHQHRLQLVATILSKGGWSPTSPNPTRWFNTPIIGLQGRTPLEFISSWKPGREVNIVRYLISNPPAFFTPKSLGLAA